MVLEDRAHIGELYQHRDRQMRHLSAIIKKVGAIEDGDYAEPGSLSVRLVALEQMKVVRAWPIYTALAVEAVAIVWLGAKLLGYA